MEGKMNIDQLIEEKKIKIMSMDELAEYLKSIGPVEIITPQFERTNGIQPVMPDGGEKWFDMLKTLPPETLYNIGLQKWEEGHWLYPSEWYKFIPAGYIVTDINGKDEAFIPGITDDDIRFGCLSYGFKTTPKPLENEGNN